MKTKLSAPPSYKSYLEQFVGAAGFVSKVNGIVWLETGQNPNGGVLAVRDDYLLVVAGNFTWSVPLSHFMVSFQSSRMAIRVAKRRNRKR